MRADSPQGSVGRQDQKAENEASIAFEIGRSPKVFVGVGLPETAMKPFG
jgi:hypothetical protein